MFRGRRVSLILLLLCASGLAAAAQQREVVKVEISPAGTTAEVGQKVKFTAVARDAQGRALDQKPTAWFAAPSDVAFIDESGEVTLYGPGEVRVGALFGNRVGYALLTVKPAGVKRVEIEPLGAPVVVGGNARLRATPRVLTGDPRHDAAVEWVSGNPSVALVDAAGLVTGVRPGRATITARSEGASATIDIEVVANPIESLSVEPPTTRARTGDVVRFKAAAKDRGGAAARNPAVRWAVSGEGAMIESDGAFVAERPGSYIVTAISGDRSAVASVVVTPRNLERQVEIVGRAIEKDIQTAEQWIIGNLCFVSTINDKMFIYDVSDPKQPKRVGSLTLDARIINDVSTTADGKIVVLTREGASNRRNGIVFVDVSDPANPKVISEYTATVTGGVHSAFVDSHYVYLTDDATGSMRVIDFRDVKNPKEVARWQTDSPLGEPLQSPLSGSTSGRYLHDVQVLDGLAYLAYWRDGLVILDVGKGIKGGSPENPKLVSQYRFNHSELYGNGWVAGTHAVFRYKDYVFVGDEVLPGEFDLASRNRFAVRGIVHILDVSDIERPRKVGEYNVPEAGAHNIWVKDDVLVMGYYSGGGRVVDVSGELRGDLYRQGREIARVWTGAPEGYRANLPLAWGAQPVGDLIYFNDINSGIWIVRLGKPVEKGSTTSPGVN